MEYKISDMTAQGKELLNKMKTEVSNYNTLIQSLSVLLPFKKLFDNPISQLLDLALPTPHEWDALSELIKESGGLKGILKNKMNLHWLKYKTNHNWNAADKAFIESLYNSVTKNK
jgi:hypothetical protein